ncbi:cell division protein FtsQ/DivIB [Gryllotalpicola reticulitermitis]|uniref:Cell division protein FtsQ/DivIB n=1 Tax=Gryllotalpicola reticulitermitis TaxID=1184153 RepID=A0ABV8QAF1_9MICO
MRRPTGPAQRPSPQASVTESEHETERVRERRVRPRDRDEPFAWPPAERAEPDPSPASASQAPESEREPAAQADAPADAPGSRLDTWRSVRRAAGERRRVERNEARRFTARTRRRRQIQLACAAFVVLVIGGAVGAAYSPLMALRHIDVVGAHGVKAAQVQQALRAELGKPLPLVRNSDVRHALDDFRLIESYSTELEPPSTLVVRITERTPLAVVKSGSSYELVDQAGVVLAAAAKPQAGYPMVTLTAGQQPESSPGYAAAASVIAALPAAVRSQVTAASATSPNDVTLSLAGGKTVVWGSADQLQLKTEDLQALLKGAGAAHTYDVSSPEAPITR